MLLTFHLFNENIIILFYKVKYLLQSAKAAHMNMIRVWGGGIYESDYFYNLADNYGLLVWQDMAFHRSSYPVTESFIEYVAC